MVLGGCPQVIILNGEIIVDKISGFGVVCVDGGTDEAAVTGDVDFLVFVIEILTYFSVSMRTPAD